MNIKRKIFTNIDPNPKKEEKILLQSKRAALRNRVIIEFQSSL